MRREGGTGQKRRRSGGVEGGGGFGRIVSTLQKGRLIGEKRIQKNPDHDQGFFVDPLGLEPRMTDPESVVLPLHHGSIEV